MTQDRERFEKWKQQVKTAMNEYVCKRLDLFDLRKRDILSPSMDAEHLAGLRVREQEIDALLDQAALSQEGAGEAVAQEENTPPEILAARLIDAWCDSHGTQIPWEKAVEITTIITHPPEAEKDRLLALSDAAPPPGDLVGALEEVSSDELYSIIAGTYQQFATDVPDDNALRQVVAALLKRSHQ